MFSSHLGLHRYKRLKFGVNAASEVFATPGIPETLKTDNGPPFQGFEFRKFMQYCGIRHRRITPLWPRSNAQAGNF